MLHSIPEDVGKGSTLLHNNTLGVEALPLGGNHPVKPAICEVTKKKEKN